MNYYVYRPEISSYQGESFRIKERQALMNLGVKYADTPIEIPDGESAIVISTSYTNNEEILKSLRHTQVKLWIHPNSGYDNFNIEFVRDNEFPIVLGNEIRANAVAQYYIQALLNYEGKIPHKKNWDKNRQYRRRLLNTKNFLIIGRGPIGQKVGNFLETLEVKVNYYDPFQNKKQSHSLLKEYFAQADVIILACSLNKTSKHILDSETFELLKSDVLIMNAARGKLIDQTALITFLNSNKESHAILDVFETEPIDFAEFKQVSNITLSSHIAGVYLDINNAIINFEKEVIRDFLRNTSISKFENSLLMDRLKGDFLI